MIGLEEAKEIAGALKRDVKAPYVNAYVTTLGGADRPTVMFTISLDPKEKWANKILENSRYAHFSLEHTGYVSQFTRSRGFPNMRAGHTKDYKHLLKRITDTIKKGPQVEFRPGAPVHVDTQTEEHGHVTGPGYIVSKTKKGYLVRIVSIRKDLVLPISDIHGY